MSSVSSTGVAQRVESDLPDGRVLALEAEAGVDAPLWAVLADAGPLRSVDGGATWQATDEGLTRSEQADAVDVPHFRDLAVAPGDGGLILLAGFDGLFGRTDGADRWEPIETLVDYIAGLAVSPMFAEDQTIVVTSYVRGAFVSRDGGASWELTNGGITTTGISEGNRFLPLRRLHNIHFLPDYADTGEVLSATWLSLLRSVDHGDWSSVRVGDAPQSQLRQFVLAPSPSFDQDSTVYVGTRQGEFFASTERGAAGSWVLRSTLNTRVRSIAPSPAVADDETIFVGTVEGAFRSTDGGSTWADLGVGNEAEVTGREVDFGVQVAVSPSFTDDRLVLVATDRALWMSRDAGASWSTVDLGVPDGAVEAVAFSPTFVDDGLILVSTRSAGLLRSRDGGGSWERVGAELWEQNLLIADYANPTSVQIRFSPTYERDGTIFAFAQGAVVRSVDQGATWDRLELPTAADVAGRVSPVDPPLLTRRRAMAIAALGAALVIALAVALLLRRRRGISSITS